MSIIERSSGRPRTQDRTYKKSSIEDGPIDLHADRTTDAVLIAQVAEGRNNLVCVIVRRDDERGSEQLQVLQENYMRLEQNPLDKRQDA